MKRSDDQIRVIGRILEMKAQGMTDLGIADRFNTENIPTFSGGGVWGKGQVNKLFNKFKDKDSGRAKAEHRTDVKKAEVRRTEAKQPDIKKTEVKADTVTVKTETAELAELKAELLKIRQELDNTVKTLDTAVRENMTLKSELRAVRQELDAERTEPAADGSAVPEQVDGWSTVLKGEYWKVYKRIDTKLHWIHIGRIWNTGAVRKKIGRYISDKGIGEPVHPGQPDQNYDMKADKSAFRAVYEKVKTGSRLAYIWKIRQALNWSRERFDRTVAELAREMKIYLQGGDPSQLTGQQIEDCYHPEYAPHPFITLEMYE